MKFSQQNYSCLQLIKLDLIRFHELKNPDSRRHVNVFLLLRLAFSPRMAPVLLFRLAHFCFICKLNSIAKLFTYLNQLLFGIEIASACHIGPGLFLPHTYGTVIGAASIGANATIFQGSTLGSKHLVFDFDPRHRPKLGSGVSIGAGSKVLGDIYIGDNVTIGANAVVLSSLPANCVAVGMPAKPV